MIKNEFQVLILAGGKGERLKPLTDNIPKPLIKINSKPFLGHQIKYLENKYQIKNFIIATGYKSKLIEEYLLDSFSHLNIKTIDSGNVDILTRIRDSKYLLKDNFLLCYGDTLADIKVEELFNFHFQHSGSVTISSYQLHSQFGILKLGEKGLVKKFMEKPKLNEWINIGYMVIDKNIIDNRQESFVKFIADLADSGLLYSFKHKGLHITVNTLSELKQAEIDIKSFN